MSNREFEIDQEIKSIISRSFLGKMSPADEANFAHLIAEGANRMRPHRNLKSLLKESKRAR